MEDDISLVQIKGIRDGLLITLGDGSWEELEPELIKNVDEQSTFFQGAKVALNVGPVELRVAEMATLRDKLSERGISLWAVISDSLVTETTAQYLGLATRISRPQPTPVKETFEAAEDAAKWVKGPLRSGGKVIFNGNVVVFGDVNPGAEIIAGGSIIVWGRLRGVVHAGAQGDRESVVCALELIPTQLRIADAIAISPKKGKNLQPEMAIIKDGQLVAEPWQTAAGR